MCEKFEEIVPVNQSVIDELEYRQNATGVAADELLLNCGNEIPDGLNSGIIASWMDGTSSQTKLEYLNFVMRVWVSPDVPNKSMVKVAPYLEEIEKQRLRTKCGSMGVLKGRKDILEGLTSSTIDSWIALKVKTAKPRYLEYVLRCYRGLDSFDASKSNQNQIAENRKRRAEEYCAIDQELVRFHFERSGVPNSYFLNGSDTPKKVNSAAIHRLRSGKTAEMYRESYDYILDKLVNAPDMKDSGGALAGSEGVSVKDTRLKDGYTLIPDDTLAILGDYHKLGLLPSKIFKHTPFRPKNPKPHTITGWLSGKTRTAKTVDLEFVLRLCKAVAAE